MVGAIYIVTNKTNHKQYVGQTIQTLYNRRKEGYGDTKFGRAIKKYGKDDFEYTILWELESEDKAQLINNLNVIEEIEIGIRNLTDRDSGYNTKMGGSNGTFKHTPEAIEKIRIAALRPNKGRFVKGQVSLRKGMKQPQTEEQKKKTSEALKKAYAEGRRTGLNKGKKMSEEHKQAIKDGWARKKLL